MTPRDPDFRAPTLAALADQPFADLLGMSAIGAGLSAGWPWRL